MPPPENEVGHIADKTPTMHGMPCAHHIGLSVGNLMGNPVPMTGQIPVAGGRRVKVEGRAGVVFDETPEAKAFSRWQNRSFLDVERSIAKDWRASLRQLDLATIAEGFRALGVDGKNCQSLEQAKLLAEQLVTGRDRPFDRMKVAISTLGLPANLHRPIMERWASAGRPPLAEFAPYAAHVVKVELFFQIALAANLIATERPSNKIDVAYLYYLPFCNVFVSSDRLHQRCVPQFLRDDQDFVWGIELKAELQRTNGHFDALPADVKEKGLSAFAHYPLGVDSDLLIRLWDRHLPAWRQLLKRDGVREPVKDSQLAKELSKWTEAPALTPDQIDFDAEDAESLTIQRYLKKRKGSWYQLPKDLKDPDGP